MKRSLALAWITLCFLICLGCGDVFRPVIIPNPPAFPDPRASHTALAISNNGSSTGSAMVINVTGDSNVSVADCQEGSPCLAPNPAHAVQQTATQVLVANSATPGSLTDSLSKIVFSGTVISSAITITLPPDSAPNFVTVLPGATTAYVALPGLVPDGGSPDNNAVGEVSTSSNQLTHTIEVGTNPVAIAETPDKEKLYVANRGRSGIAGSLTAFNTLDRSSRPLNLDGQPNPFSEPVWTLARSDSRRVYVLDKAAGSLVSLDPTSAAGTEDKVLHPLLDVGPSEYMLYDSHLNRIYVPSGAQVSIVDVASDLPTLLGNGGNPLPIAAFDPTKRSAGDPCFGDTVTTLNAVAAAALPDGSRAYIGSFYKDGAGNICPQLTVINTSSNTVKTTIAVPGFPNYDTFCATTRFRFTMAAGGDSSRVYLASCDSGGVHIIDAEHDSYIAALPAPASARPPIPPNTQPPPQNPVFLIAGP